MEFIDCVASVRWHHILGVHRTDVGTIGCREKPWAGRHYHERCHDTAIRPHDISRTWSEGRSYTVYNSDTRPAIRLYGFQWHVWDQTKETLITAREVSSIL